MPLMKADSRAAARGRKVWLSPRPLAHISLRALIWLLFIVSRPNPPLADDAPYEPGGGKGKLIIAETLGKHCGFFFVLLGIFAFVFWFFAYQSAFPLSDGFLESQEDHLHDS